VGPKLTEPWPNLLASKVGCDRSFGYEPHGKLYTERRTKTELGGGRGGSDICLPCARSGLSEFDDALNVLDSTKGYK